MREVRNSDNKLVATIDESTMTVIIIHRGCETRIRLQGPSPEVTNTKLKPT